MEEELEALEDLFLTEAEMLDFIVNGNVSSGENKISKVQEFIEGLLIQEKYCLSEEEFNRWRMGLILKLKFLKPKSNNELEKLEFFQCILACYSVLKPPKRDEMAVKLECLNRHPSATWREWLDFGEECSSFKLLPEANAAFDKVLTALKSEPDSKNLRLEVRAYVFGRRALNYLECGLFAIAAKSVFTELLERIYFNDTQVEE